ncbi:MAG: PEGA domain-containing protein [Candidatus Saccharibacteria bacterium]|nr:PEGA domain-containing protein [Candidatus Saccharibacteria bacterium]
MDMDRKRRRQKIRLIVTEILMVLAVIVTVGVLFAVVTGWRVNGDFSVEQYGQIDVRSYPTGASIVIDDEMQAFAFTNTSRMLTEGEHRIRLEREEFDTWEKTVKVIPGWAVRLRYPRLFRKERKSEEVRKLGNLDFVMVSPNRESILYSEGGSDVWRLMSIRGDEAKVKDIDLAKVSGSEVTDRYWSWSGEKILAKDKEGNWTVINLNQPKESVKLGKYAKVSFMNGSGSKVWALKDGALYSIELGVGDGVRKVLEGVENFVADENEIAYLAKDGEKRKVMLYHDGDGGGVELSKDLSAEAKVWLAASTYAGEKFVSIVVDDYLTIYRMNDYPTYNSDFEEAKIAVQKKLDFAPEAETEISRSGEFYVYRNGEEVVVFDAELAECSQYRYPSKKIIWLDDYMLADTSDGKVTVMDFDGTNVRTLVSENVAEFPAVVTANNKWLYYIVGGEKDFRLMREQVN